MTISRTDTELKPNTADPLTWLLLLMTAAGWVLVLLTSLGSSPLPGAAEDWLVVANVLTLGCCLQLGWRYWSSQQHSLALALKLQATFDDAAVGMAHVAQDGKILRANHRFAELLQLSPQDMRGLTFQQLTHPDDLAEDLKYLDALVRGEIDSYDMEKRYRRADGSYVWGHLSVSFHRGHHTANSYFVSVIENIQERKQAALALQASMAQVQLLLDATGDAIIGLNLDGEITFANQTAEQQLGYNSQAPLNGLPLTAVLHKHKAALTQWREISKALEQAKAVSGEADLFVSRARRRDPGGISRNSGTAHP